MVEKDVLSVFKTLVWTLIVGLRKQLKDAKKMLLSTRASQQHFCLGVSFGLLLALRSSSPHCFVLQLGSLGWASTPEQWAKPYVAWQAPLPLAFFFFSFGFNDVFMLLLRHTPTHSVGSQAGEQASCGSASLLRRELAPFRLLRR